MESYEEIVDDLCARYARVQPGKLFGMECFKANGRAAGGLWNGSMVFKLKDASVRERALALEGAHLFAPMKERPMKEWVVVPATQSQQWAAFAQAAVS